MTFEISFIFISKRTIFGGTIASIRQRLLYIIFYNGPYKTIYILLRIVMKKIHSRQACIWVISASFQRPLCLRATISHTGAAHCVQQLLVFIDIPETVRDKTRQINLFRPRVRDKNQ